MKDGKIAAQGTLDDIIAADPDMYSEYNKAVELASESEAEMEQSGYESDSVKDKRMRLLQQVKSAIMTEKLTKGKGKNTPRQCFPCPFKSETADIVTFSDHFAVKIGHKGKTCVLIKHVTVVLIMSLLYDLYQELRMCRWNYS